MADDDYKTDQRSSRRVIEDYRAGFENEDDESSLLPIHWRGGKDEFVLALEYCGSDDPFDRATGAYALRQLGLKDGGTFVEESIDILIPMLNDPSPEVLEAVLIALGHRGGERIVEPKAALRNHPDPDVRWAVIDMGASNNPLAVATIIELTTDPDDDVRNWALFQLGTQMDMDTPAVRSALARGLSETDSEPRGEAIVGLAKRNDARACVAILSAWELEWIGKLSLEAAQQLGDPRLLDRLNELADTWEPGEMLDKVNEAIDSCKHGVLPSRTYQSDELNQRIRVDRSESQARVFLVSGADETEIGLDDDRYWQTLTTGYPVDDRNHIRWTALAKMHQIADESGMDL